MARMHRSQVLYRALVLLLAAAVSGLVAAQLLAENRPKGTRRTRDVSSFRKQLSEKREKFVAGLEDLARTCDEKKRPDAAAGIRLLARPVDASEVRLTAVPRRVQPALSQDLPPDEH